MAVCCAEAVLEAAVCVFAAVGRDDAGFGALEAALDITVDVGWEGALDRVGAGGLCCFCGAGGGGCFCGGCDRDGVAEGLGGEEGGDEEVG